MGSLRSLRKKDIEEPPTKPNKEWSNWLDIVLGSGKGPIQEPRLIKTHEEFVEVFGTTHYDGKYKVEENSEWETILTALKCLRPQRQP
jgi:hypothetical protein